MGVTYPSIISHCISFAYPLGMEPIPAKVSGWSTPWLVLMQYNHVNIQYVPMKKTKKSVIVTATMKINQPFVIAMTIKILK